MQRQSSCIFYWPDVSGLDSWSSLPFQVSIQFDPKCGPKTSNLWMAIFRSTANWTVAVLHCHRGVEASGGAASQYACASRRESPYSQHDSQECRAAGADRDDFADGPVVGPFRDRHMGYCDWRGSCNSGAGLTHSSAGRRESGGVLLGVPENAIVIASGGHST